MVGCYISDELKEMALSMSLQGLQDSEVHEYTGISMRSIKRLRSTYRKIGQVSRKPVIPGRQRNLTSMQTQFLCDCINHQPDIALKELQAKLHEVCGTETLVQTIARSLQHEGYTMKSVRPSQFFVWSSHSQLTTVDHTPCSGAKRAGSRGVQAHYQHRIPP